MAKTKIFLDAEFTGLHKLTTLISIGLVAEDGKEFYAEFTDFDKHQVDPFIAQHVLPKRILEDYNFERDYDPNADTVLVKGDIDVVHNTMLDWLKKYEKEGIQMWGDLLAYDWILFISVFGSGHQLPKFIDYIPMDLCTALPLFGVDQDIDRDVFAYGEELAAERKKNKHNSLYDAQTQMAVYKKLMEIQSKAVEELKEGLEEIEEETETVLEEMEDNNPPMMQVVEDAIEEEMKDENPKEESDMPSTMMAEDMNTGEPVSLKTGEKISKEEESDEKSEEVTEQPKAEKSDA
jgi:hypothetical protein